MGLSLGAKQQEPVSAVVVGANLNGLGVVRSLRAAGLRTTVVGMSRREPALWARGARAVLIPQLHGLTLIKGLLSLRHRFGRDPVLILTDEMAVFTVSEHRQALENRYRFVLPTPETVVALADKAAFHALAEAHGLPAPRSTVLTTVTDLVDLHRLRLPLIIKPSEKQAVYSGQAARIHRAETIAEAERICRDMVVQAGTVVVQEWIPGPDDNIVFCLFYARKDGEIVSLFTGRKLRSEPPQIGSTGLCVAAPEAAPAVEPMTRRFVRAVGFAGLGSMEFKWHAGAKAFLVIEPTVGRTDWQEEIATLCGENVPYQAYRDACGLPPLPSDPPRSCAWRASMRQRWPQDVSYSVERIHDALWRPGDPLPALIALTNALSGRIAALPRYAALGSGRPLIDRVVSRKAGL